MNTSLAEQPAYPLTILEGMINNEGMTLRQYYAGLAMQGLLANGKKWSGLTDDYDNAKNISKLAVKIADALLTALSQEPLNNKQ